MKKSVECPLRANKQKYLDQLHFEVLGATVADEVLFAAIDDGVTELEITNDDYFQIRRFLVANGIATWNWDRQRGTKQE